MPDWRTAVNGVAAADEIGDIQSYLSPANEHRSPIDGFYSRTKEIIMAVPTLFSAYPAAGNLAVVGIVAATELYFRQVFAGVLELCPVAQKQSCKKNVNIGSVMWCGPGWLHQAAFENVSFADSDALTSVFKEYIGMPIDKRSALAGALDAYGEVCQLRHCIVHSASVLSGRNASTLSIPRSKDSSPLVVSATVAHVHECAAVCNSLVQAANAELFHLMCIRLRTDWATSVDKWSKALERRMFRKIWRVFRSDQDAQSGQLATPLTLAQCFRALVEKI